MIFKYYSNWIIPLSVIWIILHRVKSPLINYFNPYYSLIVICVGYILFSIYLILYKGYEFNISFILLFIIHYLPLHYMLTNNTREYSLETLIISYSIYTLYYNILYYPGIYYVTTVHTPPALT